jgi:PAS domain S-box-containing protein
MPPQRGDDDVSALGLGLTEPVGMALAGVPALLNFGLLLFAAWRLPRERITYVFLFYLTTLVCWQLFDFTVRSAIDEDWARLWRALLRVWQFIAISCSLHMALMFSRLERVAHHPVTLGLLYVPCLLFESIYTAGIIDEHLERVPVWGWISDSRDLGPAFSILSGWFGLEAVAAAAIIALNVWWTRGQGDRHRAARVLAAGMAIPVGLGLACETVLPLVFGIRQIPLTSTWMSTFTVAIVVALARYDLFEVNTLAAAQAVLQTISDSLLVVHRSGRIRYLNPFATTTFGAREGQALAELFSSADDHDTFVRGPMARALAGARSSGTELVLRDARGELVRAQVSLGPLHTDTVGASVVVVVHDVGPLKRIQEELATARDAAEAANKAKTLFLATTSHELRTPLNAIIGYSELLAEAAEDDGDTERHADLKRIERSGRMLLTLIDDLIDLSRVEAGRLTVHPAPFSPAELLREVAPLAIELCRRKGNVFAFDDSPDHRQVLGDRQRVRQVLLNLISNAAKFTEKGDVRLWVTHEGDRARFHVSDTGIGMSPEGLSRLFGLFNQVHTNDHATYGGAGIGLALSRRLCRMMDGDLKVTSQLGHGSTFWMDLPVAPLPGERAGG